MMLKICFTFSHFFLQLDAVSLGNNNQDSSHDGRYCSGSRAMARMSYPAPNYYVYDTMMAILARTIDLAHTRETRLLTYLCKRPLPATPGRLFQRRGEKQNWQNDIVARRALQRRNKPFAACRRCFFVCECENAITGSLML